MLDLPNVAQILTQHAARLPDKIAVQDLARALTYSQWNERACRLANALLDAAAARVPAGPSAELDALLAHTERHFADEEAILERIGYHSLTEHRRAHAGLLRRAGVLRARVSAGEAKFGAIVEFLAQDVVARHLIALDRAFFPLLVERTGATNPP